MAAKQKNGDPVVQLTTDDKGTINAVGFLVNATPGNNYCNGSIANPSTQSFTDACLCDCLHINAVAALLIEKGWHKRPSSK